MDGFDKKREMVHVLMNMLKKSASDEVQQGLPKTTLLGPKVEAGHGVSPDTQKAHKEGPSGHPHVIDLTQSNDIQQKTSDNTKMAEGGLAGTDMHESDQASRLTEPVTNPADSNQDETALNLLPEAPQDEQGEEAERQDGHNKDIEYDDEDNNSSSFEAFLPRRKKK